MFSRTVRIQLSIGLVVGFLLCGCRGESPGEAGVNQSREELPRVSTAFPVRKNFAQKTEQPGQIEAFASAPIHAKVSGYVKSVLVDIGDKVAGPKLDANGNATQPGQPLAVIDAPEILEDVRQKEAKVQQAKADARQSQAAIRVAEAAAESALAKVEETKSEQSEAMAGYERWKSEFVRISELAASKTVTQKLADETEQQYRAAEAAIAAVGARIRSAESSATEAQVAVEKSRADAESVAARLAVAEAELRSSQVMADYLTLRAPFDGVVSTRDIDPGRLVQSAKGANDRPLLTVIQADTVRLFIEVPENDAVLVAPGRKATIRVAAAAGKPFEGSVARTSWTLSASNRTLRTEIDIPNGEGILRPGMFAQVELIVAEREGALVVPKGAVVSLDGRPGCLAVSSSGVLEKKVVETGLKSATEVEIKSGLTESDEVIVANAAAFKPGQKVEKSAAK